MFPLRRVQNHMLNSVMASQLGCHRVLKTEYVKVLTSRFPPNWLFLHIPFLLRAPPLSNTGARKPGLLLSSSSPSLPFLNSHQALLILPPECLPDWIHLSPLPSPKNSFWLLLFLSWIIEISSVTTISSSTALHLPRLQRYLSKVTYRTSQLHEENPLNFYVLCGNSMSFEN